MVAGDHWQEWLSTSCPALIIKGKDSRVTTQSHLEQMALLRPNTTLCILDGSHVIHSENPKEFIKVVEKFLEKLA